MSEEYKTIDDFMKSSPTKEQIKEFLEERFSKDQFEDIGEFLKATNKTVNDILKGERDIPPEELISFRAATQMYDIFLPRETAKMLKILTSPIDSLIILDEKLRNSEYVEKYKELLPVLAESCLKMITNLSVWLNEGDTEGTDTNDKDSDLCKSEGMRDITNTLEILPEGYQKQEYGQFLLATYVREFFKGKETEKVVPVRNTKTKETAEVLLKILPREITSSESIQFENPLDEEDREIVNAIHTIWESEARRFTPQNVYEAMTGEKAKNKTTLDNIRKRIDKLEQTKVSIYLQELFEKVLRKKDIPDNQKIIWESRILSIDKFRWVDEHNKQTIQEGYVFLKEPTLTSVCKMCNYQIARVPMGVLSATTKRVSNTPSTIALKNYLAMRISSMKNDKKVNRDILFDTIFEDNNMSNKSKTEINRLRTTLFTILDVFKEEKYIKNYSVNKKGNKYHSITIGL